MRRTLNVHAGTGPGRYRDTWGIRRQLDLAGVSMAEIGRRLGVQPQAVTATVRGVKNNRRVLRYLLEELGVPAGLLSLPEDMQDKKES